MALAVDASSARTGTNSTNQVEASAAFSTAAANEIVVVLVATTDNAGAGHNAMSLSLAGAGLTWTRAVQQNGNGNQVAAIFWAPAPTALTSQTVSATVTGTANVGSWAIEVLSFTGANTSSPIGATGAATNPNGTTANPSVVLATAAGSFCVAAGADYFSNKTIAAAGAAQTLLAVYQDTTNGEVEWTQRTTAATGTSTTMGDSGLGSDGWVFVAAEILAAAAADPFPLVYDVAQARLQSAVYRM